MANPTSYNNEREFALWMQDELGPYAKDLELSVGDTDPGDYQQPVNESLDTYGELDITQVDNTVALRNIGRYALWRYVANLLSGRFDYQARDAEGAVYTQSQVYEHARTQQELARQELNPAFYGL